MRSRCEPILQRFNFHWPTSLDCDGLPSHSTRDDLCIEPPGEHDSFPGDDSQLDAAPDLLHRPAGTHGNHNDNYNYKFIDSWTNASVRKTTERRRHTVEIYASSPPLGPIG